MLGDRTGLPAALERPEFGTIVEVLAGGGTLRRANVSEYETLVDPDGEGVDANPTSLTTDGSRFFAVDAGGNAAWRFNQYGAGRLLSVFPRGEVGDVSYQAVPTAITVGPDAAMYVATLTGHPFPLGQAAVYKIASGVPVAVHTGFTNIIDIAFAPDGSLYVLEIARAGLLETGPDGLTAGRLVRIDPDGARTVVSGAELRSPGGVAVAADGAVYVTNRATRPGTGQVLRYPPAPEQGLRSPGG